jgi:hypothetical protein
VVHEPGPAVDLLRPVVRPLDLEMERLHAEGAATRRQELDGAPAEAAAAVRRIEIDLVDEGVGAPVLQAPPEGQDGVSGRAAAALDDVDAPEARRAHQADEGFARRPRPEGQAVVGVQRPHEGQQAAHVPRSRPPEPHAAGGWSFTAPA